MNYLMCKHKVADYAAWRSVFDSHAAAQRQAGLHLLHVLRDADDPNMVVLVFTTDDLAKARAFTQAGREAGRDAGVIGTPEILFLSEH